LNQSVGSLIRAGALACWFAGHSSMAAPAPTPAADVDIEAVTEDWPPYNFTAHGVVRGITTDLLRETCEIAGLKCRIELMPWARAKMMTLTRPATLLFTTARTPEREHQFVWIGPVAPRATWIFQLDKPGSTDCVPSDRAHPCRYGVVRGDAAYDDLLAAGVPAANIEPGADVTQNFRKLLAGHIDAVTDNDLSMRWLVKELGTESYRLRRAGMLSQRGAYYFALNPLTPQALTDRLDAAFKTLAAKHRPEELAKQYAPDLQNAP